MAPGFYRRPGRGRGAAGGSRPRRRGYYMLGSQRMWIKMSYPGARATTTGRTAARAFSL